ncbi:MAG: type II toxin-antitoxin system VapC family toxin [Myxococcaceae bacterium]
MRVLLDTGPLVAFLSRRDRHHSWSKQTLGGLLAPLRTCESVVSEACFLLQSISGAADAIFELIHTGLIRIDFQVQPDSGSIRKLMNRYANVPMSLADACLVRMSELDRQAVILTVDSDFRVYRRNGREVLPLISP